MTAFTSLAGTGLSSAQAAERQRLHGRNELPAVRPPSVIGRVAAQLRDPLVLVLVAAMIVTAVPESLPVVVTLALALGAHRMARQAAIVRRLPAVETLGSVTVLATDKTGTLTKGVMSVDRFVLPDGGAVALHGRGYDPAGDAEPAVSPAARRLAEAVLLCNDAALAPPAGPEPRWRPVGDPMEAALVCAAARCGVPQDLREQLPRRSTRPGAG